MAGTRKAVILIPGDTEWGISEMERAELIDDALRELHRMSPPWGELDRTTEFDVTEVINGVEMAGSRTTVTVTYPQARITTKEQ